MNFRVGQKVVCIDASPPFGSFSPLKEGAIYTVAGTDNSPHSKGQAIAVSEVSVPGDSLLTGFFYSSRFRPAVERKTQTGMAILREILERESHQDRAPERVRE